MQHIGVRGQQYRDFTYDASGTITSGGTAQLVLCESKQRSSLLIQNISDTAMYVEIGAARATAVLTSGKITSFSITNAGFGYTIPPIIQIVGGGPAPSTMGQGGNQVGYPSPPHIATAHAVLTTGAVSSIVIDDPGAGYLCAPYVLMYNSLNDPFGVAIPSATNGILLAANGGSYYDNGTACSTDAISIFCASSSKPFTCKYTS